MRLTLETLEVRENPAAFDPAFFAAGFEPIPGWVGPIVTTNADVDGNGTPDNVYAAGEGGAPRVVVYSGGRLNEAPVPSGTPGVLKTAGAGDVLFDGFVFEESFRGGADVTFIHDPGPGPDRLVFVPGPGGGPRVRVMTLDGTVDFSFLAFDDPNYRGGLTTHQTEFAPEIPSPPRPINTHLLILPLEGGGPRAATIDLNGTVVADFLVGPADDRRPIRVLGAGVDLPGRPGHQAIYTQDADGVVRAYDWTGTEYPISDDDFGPRAAAAAV